ncbi:MAG TPA: hypothetical protein VFX28_10720 [Methylomirabilota bacterium]|nr:hypothetical protein [Methylomirabilota bacterium]
MPYDSHLVETAPVDLEASLALARRARRFLLKTGSGVVRLDRARAPVTEPALTAALVHEDGFLRVPVLLVGDLLVRGYTEALYREALAGGGGLHPA